MKFLLKLLILASLCASCHEATAETYTQWYRYTQIMAQSDSAHTEFSKADLSRRIVTALGWVKKAIEAIQNNDNEWCYRNRRIMYVCDDAGHFIDDAATLIAREDELTSIATSHDLPTTKEDLITRGYHSAWVNLGYEF